MNFELILVDDGSTDNTLAIAHEFASKDSRIKVLTQNHAYAGVARNLGMQHAQGKYFLFLDADDFFDPNLLLHSLNCIQKNNADICVFGANSLNIKTGKTRPLKQLCRTRVCPQDKIFNRKTNTKYIFCFTSPAPWNKLFKASFIREHEITFQDTRSANDFRFVLCALAEAQRICLLNEPLVNYRQHNSNSLQGSQSKDPHAFLEALMGLKSELISRGLFKELYRPFANTALDFLMYNMRTLEKSPDAHYEIYKLLKEHGFKDAEILNKSRFYFYGYPLNRWQDFSHMLNGSYEDYLAYRAKPHPLQRKLDKIWRKYFC